MNTDKHGFQSIRQRFRDRTGMDRAVNNAVRDALRRHILLGESVAVADENGGVKTLGPEEIKAISDAN